MNIHYGRCLRDAMRFGLKNRKLWVVGVFASIFVGVLSYQVIASIPTVFEAAFPNSEEIARDSVFFAFINFPLFIYNPLHYVIHLELIRRYLLVFVLAGVIPLLWYLKRVASLVLIRMAEGEGLKKITAQNAIDQLLFTNRSLLKIFVFDCIYGVMSLFLFGLTLLIWIPERLGIPAGGVILAFPILPLFFFGTILIVIWKRMAERYLILRQKGVFFSISKSFTQIKEHIINSGMSWLVSLVIEIMSIGVQILSRFSLWLVWGSALLLIGLSSMPPQNSSSSEIMAQMSREAIVVATLVSIPILVIEKVALAPFAVMKERYWNNIFSGLENAKS